MSTFSELVPVKYRIGAGNCFAEVLAIILPRWDIVGLVSGGLWPWLSKGKGFAAELKRNQSKKIIRKKEFCLQHPLYSSSSKHCVLCVSTVLSSNLWTSCDGPNHRQSAVLVEDKRSEHGETPTWCSWIRLPIRRHIRKIAKSDYQISHVCLSVCMPGIGIPLNGLSRNWIFDIFPKSVEKIQVSLKSNKNNGTLHEVDR